MCWEEELLVSSVGDDIRQSQHDIHLCSSDIAHVKTEFMMVNIYL